MLFPITFSIPESKIISLERIMEGTVAQQLENIIGRPVDQQARDFYRQWMTLN